MGSILDDAVVTDAMTAGSRALRRLDRSSAWSRCFQRWVATGVLALATVVVGIVLGSVELEERR